MKTNNNPKGFIMVIAMVTTVVVTGGAILLGSAVIDNVHKQGCGSSLSAWQNGDIYGDLADANNDEALDAALKCKKSVHDAVQTAKPVATLISSAGNIGGGADNLATVGVDRMMDLTDNLSNPEHKHPVRDALLPPAITAKIEEHMKEDEPTEPEKEVEEELPANEEIQEEPEESVEIEVESDEDNDTKLELQELPEPKFEEVSSVQTSPYIGNRMAQFSRPNTFTITEDGITAITSETTSGYINLVIEEDGSASCDVQMKTVFTTELSIEGAPTANGSGNASSITCSGDIDSEGTFLLFGNIGGSVVVQGDVVEDEGPFNVTGYIDDKGKMNGNISITGVTSVDFKE